MSYNTTKSKLTRDEELNLFKKYRILQNTRRKNLDEDKIKKTETLLDKIKETLIEHNLGLVFTMCHRHKNKIGYQLEFDDLVQFGMIGLINAVEHYDYDSGVKFSTYAAKTIELTMFRQISDTARIIKIPERVIHKFLKIRRDPAEKENYDDNSFFNMCVMGVLFNERVSIETIADVARSSYSPLDDLSDYFLERDLKSALSKLTEREQLVVKHFYGVCGKAKMSCEQLSKLMDVSKPTVYNVLDEAIQKLKNKKKYLEGWENEQ